MSSRLRLASLFSVVALGACGGGGGPIAFPPPPVAPAIAPGPAVVTGEASAPFLPSANPTKIVFGFASRTEGKLATFTQVQGGAVTAIDGLTLGSPQTVRDIAGDANFAVGRWAAGTVSGTSI